MHAYVHSGTGACGYNFPIEVAQTPAEGLSKRWLRRKAGIHASIHQDMCFFGRTLYVDWHRGVDIASLWKQVFKVLSM